MKGLIIMKITKTEIKIRDLVQGYSDDGEGGVYGYGGMYPA